MHLDERKQHILHAIIRLYCAQGEPIGSTSLANHFPYAVSSATLRNEMAVLTKLGLLEQPHTSAGRIPTAKGYRYYFDYLMDTPNHLKQSEQQYADILFANMDYDPEKMTQQAAKALSDWTGYTTAITTPLCKDMGIAHFEVMQVGRFTAAVLAVTNAGSVLTRTAKLESPLLEQDILHTTQVLNYCLCFRSIADVSHHDLQVAAAMLGQRGKFCFPILQAAYELLKQAGNQNIYLEGQKNILSYAPGQILRRLLELFSDTDAFQALLQTDQMRTHILLEEDIPYTLSGLCVLKKAYIAGGGRRGTISIIGPARMSYLQVIPKLEYFALLLGNCLSGIATPFCEQ